MFSFHFNFKVKNLNFRFGQKFHQFHTATLKKFNIFFKRWMSKFIFVLKSYWAKFIYILELLTLCHNSQLLIRWNGSRKSTAMLSGCNGLLSIYLYNTSHYTSFVYFSSISLYVDFVFLISLLSLSLGY